jgi:GNAT superfamily N-acetyltransferase
VAWSGRDDECGAVSPADLSFEPASAADMEALADLRVEAMRDSLEQLGRFDPDRARQRIRDGFMPECTRHIAVAGHRVGFLVVKRTPAGMLLDHLYVSPAHQGRGIGSLVMSRLIAEARQSQLDIHVGALRGSRSNAFYLRHGFIQTDEGPWDIYYSRPHEPAA